MSWKESPNKIEIIYGKLIPKTGGDTLFTNLELAYDRLNINIKKMVENLTCIHTPVNG